MSDNALTLRRTALQWLVAARMPVILLALIIAATAMTNGRFAEIPNLVNVMRQVSFEGLIAFGMTLVIITGGIDLSVGSVVAFCGVAGAIVLQHATQSWGWPAGGAVAIGMASGVAVGAIVGGLSGITVARLSIPPFIVTLAVMLMARGGAFILCDGQPVYELPMSFRWWGRGFVCESVFGQRLPTTVLVLLVGYAAFSFLLARTVFGRSVIAVGSSEQAAYLAGIPVRRTKFLVYLITGGLAGLAGVLHDAKLMAGDPKVGELWELNVIAAVVVGGTSLFGGRGSMTGTLIGALIIGVLNNSLNLMHVEHFWQKVVLGGVILAASLLDAGLRKLDAR